MPIHVLALAPEWSAPNHGVTSTVRFSSFKVSGAGGL